MSIIKIRIIGRKQSQATKDKLSKLRMGDKNPFYGKKHSEETLLKLRSMSSWNKGIPMLSEQKLKISGVNHYLWKGGVSKDKEYRRKYFREHYRNFPTKRRNNQKRMALQQGGGKITKEEIQQVYENNIKKYGTLTCYLCLKPILFGNDCLEHKIPLSRGGTNAKDNLDIAHNICNIKKKNKTDVEYLTLLA